jgi:hypothetical protein
MEVDEQNAVRYMSVAADNKAVQLRRDCDILQFQL